MFIFFTSAPFVVSFFFKHPMSLLMYGQCIWTTDAFPQGNVITLQQHLVIAYCNLCNYVDAKTLPHKRKV